MLGQGAYAFVIALCAGAGGIMLGLLLYDLAFDAHLITANAAIDDDAMIITMGWAMGGCLLGLLAGAIFGWRVITATGRG
jgi:hypothetical protein